MGKYRQKTELSRFSIICTIIVMLVLAGLLAFGATNPGSAIVIALTVIFGFMLLMYTVFGIYYCPREVVVDYNTLTIHKLIGRKIIPLNEIESVSAYEPGEQGLHGWLGSGGFFGFWGYSKNADLGRFFCYAANLQNLIVVKLKDGRKYLISCDEPAKMARAANVRISC